MSKDTGGPAFPVPNLQDDEDFNGMTLRDYFAAKTLASHDMYADNAYSLGSAEHREFLAIDCYAMADAMLKARAA